MVPTEGTTSQAERRTDVLHFRVKGLKIVGFLASDKKKLIIRAGSPRRGYIKYRTDTKKVGEDGCPVDLPVKHGEHTETLAVEVSRFHWIWPNKLLASIGIPIAELRLSGDGDFQRYMTIHRGKPYFDSLCLSVQADGHTYPDLSISPSTTMELVQSSSSPSAMRVPSEHSTFAPIAKDDSATQISELEPKVEEKRIAVERNQKYFDLGDSIIQKLEILSEVHDVARMAYAVVHNVYSLIKSSYENDEAIVGLYDDMIETYKIALEKDALQVQGPFPEIFSEILRVSQDCEIFLSSCLSRGRLKSLINPQTSKIIEFKDTFSQLRRKFNDYQLKVATVTVLNTQKVLNYMALNSRLEILKPTNHILPPKSLCSSGTRRESLTKILDWIFHKDQSILWISGIAGCGKSSLIGTLHQELTDWGTKSPLAAFIRFDRSTYNTASEFIKALAFLLAKFDSRLGERIAQAIESSPSVIDTPNLDYQAKRLIVEPLKDSEIVTEGRIVVLVDGIDECLREDRAETKFRKQLLELFANNRFISLPFLRFVLASRPEEDIALYLQHCAHIHHFPLDHTSHETKSDIHYFLTTSFRDKAFASLDNTRKCSAVERLAERASGLFVWAATVVIFIGENVMERLDLFTQEEPPKDPLHTLTILYETALNSLVNQHGDEDIQENICVALGLIIVSRPSVQVLHNLVKYVYPKKEAGIVGAFRKLQSLVIITQEHGAYQLLHKSFDDFLTSKDRAGHWYIDMEKYKAILYKAMITCTMDHLDKADEELPEALSSDLYRYALDGPPFSATQDRSLYLSLQQTLERFLLGYVVRWLRSFDNDLSKKGGSHTQRWFGEGCGEQAVKLQHNSEFMQKAWLGVSRLRHITKRPLVVKDFFNIMLYDAILAGKVTKANADDQHALEWEVDNIYMSVFVKMAGGSNVYKEIVAVLDKNPIPPVVSLSVEIEMPIKIVSGGRIRMKTESVLWGKEASTKDFIEWGTYVEGGWVLIAEPKNRDEWGNSESSESDDTSESDSDNSSESDK